MSNIFSVLIICMGDSALKCFSCLMFMDPSFLS